MVKLLMADLVVEIDNLYPYIPRYCKDYFYDGDRPTDISVAVTEEEILKEQAASEIKMHKAYVEFICAYRKIAYQLLKFDAFVMHGAVIRVEDKGIAFLASSGTGKTTHMALWQEICGDKLTIINGDKPIIRFFDDVPYAYGTPWSGKERYNTNDRTILTDLCFIERAPKDEVVELSPLNSAVLLLNQIHRPNDPSILNKTYALTDKLLKKCNSRKIKCTKEITAAKAAYNAIFGE